MNIRSRIFRLSLACFGLIVCSVFLSATPGHAYSSQEPVATSTRTPLTSMELVAMINRSRTGRGLPALIVDSILMSTSQTTADIMAAYHMTSHIGDVRGRVIAAGYGAGDIPWATENFAVFPLGEDPNILYQVWADDLHMKPMADPNYRHIGTGVAITQDGDIYYIVHAAYTSNKMYQPNPTPAPGKPAAQVLSQYIYAVQTVTPSENGSLVHVVRNGQSMWSIAIAYGVHIIDLQRLNGYLDDQYTLWEGQKLRIPARTATAAVETATPAHAQQPTETATVPPEPTQAEPTAIAADAIPATGSDMEQGALADQGALREQWIFNILIILAVVGAALTLIGFLVKH